MIRKIASKLKIVLGFVTVQIEEQNFGMAILFNSKIVLYLSQLHFLMIKVNKRPVKH
jgi:hypothetical protein